MGGADESGRSAGAANTRLFGAYGFLLLSQFLLPSSLASRSAWALSERHINWISESLWVYITKYKHLGVARHYALSVSFKLAVKRCNRHGRPGCRAGRVRSWRYQRHHTPRTAR